MVIYCPPMSQLSSELVRACTARQGRLQNRLTQLRLDALLINCEKDIQYLTGFVGHDSLLLVVAGDAGREAVIISDPRYDEFLEPWRKAAAAAVVMGKRHRLHETVKLQCNLRRLKRVGIQADHVTIAGREKFADALGESRLVETKSLVSDLRTIKDDLEIAAIERAIDIQQGALTAALEQLTLGMSELEFSAVLEYQMKMRGAFGTAFSPIIGAGANSSIIHHMSGDTEIQSGALLVDWGATVAGLNGDLTRTFGVGKMPAKIREIYPIVLEAQMAAIDAIAPGKICADIDAVARRIIVNAGYGEYFGHGLGHGLGMDVHESPYFNDLQTDVALKTGMIMTVEPGIYIPGVGGVRIEDDVLVTDTGARVLSDFPKDLNSAVIQPSLVRA
jgi:Xaa-Pro aminopeptidase